MTDATHEAAKLKGAQQVSPSVSLPDQNNVPASPDLMPPSKLEVVVGRLGRPHGVRGQCTVALHTDEPHRRFTVGTQLQTLPDHHGPLTLSSAQNIHNRWVLAFTQITTREQVERLRGVYLTLAVDRDESPSSPEEFYDHQLVGCHCFVNGQSVGVVSHLIHGSQDLLVVSDSQGNQTMVPFVKAIVPEVDVSLRKIILTPPEGLFL